MRERVRANEGEGGAQFIKKVELLSKRLSSKNGSGTGKAELELRFKKRKEAGREGAGYTNDRLRGGRQGCGRSGRSGGSGGSSHLFFSLAGATRLAPAVAGGCAVRMRAALPQIERGPGWEWQGMGGR